MQDFDAILSAAQSLPAGDRLRLISALWDSVPPDDDVLISDAWTDEVGRRVSEINAGTATLIPWSEIRREALDRIGHDTKE